MIFFVIVIAPFLKTINDPGERSNIYQMVGKRFRFWGWIAIISLLVTGYSNIFLMGISLETLLSKEFYSSAFGRTLIIKLSLVTYIVISSLFHDFVFGPKARHNALAGTIARYIGRTNLVVAIFIVFSAVALRLGGF